MLVAVGLLLLATSEDGFRAVFALPEIDPGLCHQMVILADRCNGEPLRKADGPYQIVEEDAKQRGRWVKRVTSSRSARLPTRRRRRHRPRPLPGGENATCEPRLSGGDGAGRRRIGDVQGGRRAAQADCVFCFDYLKNEVARYVPRNKIEVAPPTLMGRYRART